MSLAAETREAVRQQPVLYDALLAGVINYTAAAEQLSVEGDREAIATALRRFAEREESDTVEGPNADRELTVRMKSRIEPAGDAASLLGVADGGDSDDDSDEARESKLPDAATAIYATGDVDSELLARVCDRLRIADIAVHAAGVAGESLVVVVDRRAGATTLQIVESMAESSSFVSTA